jgi:hypothetical protein
MNQVIYAGMEIFSLFFLAAGGGEGPQDVEQNSDVERIQGALPNNFVRNFIRDSFFFEELFLKNQFNRKQCTSLENNAILSNIYILIIEKHKWIKSFLQSR